MRWRPSTSDHVRARAICPTAAAAWLSSSLSGPGGSLSTARPSAIAPDETTSTSRLSRCRSAMSSASAERQSSCTRPPSLATRRDEPTFTTMRRKSVREGAFRDMFRAATDRRHATTIVAPAPCLACGFGGTPRGVTDEQGVDRHLGLDLRRLARSVLPSGSGEKELALVVRQPVSHRRDQWLVLPHAVAGSSGGVARSNASGFPVRLESIEVHH